MKRHFSRRRFFARTALTISCLTGVTQFNANAGLFTPAKGRRRPRETVRDHFWMWAHEAHAYDNSYGLPRNGRMTPVEGAHFMGVPNVVLVRYEGKPAPPFEQFAIPFASLKRIHWSITGASGATSDEEREHVLRLAASTPSISGVFMDDFFRIPEAQTRAAAPPQATAPEAPAALTVEQLQAIRRQLDNVGGRRLDLGVTLYTHQLNPSILSHLALCDVVSLWTWRFEDLEHLEANLTALERMAPAKRLWLGCYMWGFGTGKPIPIHLMEKQCELGLKWLKKGRIEAMVFCATNICDLGLEAVAWTRKWISGAGEQSL